MKRRRHMLNRGMSIIELLMIASLVFILASLVIVAMNPVGASTAARNAERWSAVNELGNAIYRARADGNFTPPEARSTPYEICRIELAKDKCIARGGIDISSLIPRYLGAIPVDPSSEDDNITGYSVFFAPEGRIEITAALSEGGDRITAAR